MYTTDRYSTQKILKPSLKLIGAKTEIRDKLYRFFPEHDYYIECFCGTGGVLIGKPQSKVELIGDLNEYLINYYQLLQVEDTREQFFQEMQKTHKHFVREGEEFFHYMRKQITQETDSIIQAVYFYLITKHCFNGIWRLNKDGECNSAWGGTTRGRGIFTRKWFDAVCKRIDDVAFAVADYKTTLTVAKDFPAERTFVFLDPPYHDCKTTYNGESFDDNDFYMLEQWLQQLDCNWMLTINDDEFIRKLFNSTRYQILGHDVNYQCSQTVEGRGDHPELIVTNYNLLDTLNSKSAIQYTRVFV